MTISNNLLTFYGICTIYNFVSLSDEKNKLIVLKLLRGYLELLELHVYQLTCSPSHITRLLQALVQVRDNVVLSKYH